MPASLCLTGYDRSEWSPASDIYIDVIKVYIERVEAPKVAIHDAGRPNFVAPDDSIGIDLSVPAT